jgi:hypothetical protein
MRVFVTALSFAAFAMASSAMAGAHDGSRTAQAQVDIVVQQVGIGGRMGSDVLINRPEPKSESSGF